MPEKYMNRLRLKPLTKTSMGERRVNKLFVPGKHQAWFIEMIEISIVEGARQNVLVLKK